MNFKSKTKLLVPIVVLIAILMFLAVFVIGSYYSKIDSLNELNKKMSFSTDISDLVHSLQKERGLSSGYITSKDVQFYSELITQRETTDKMFEKLFESYEKLDTKDLKNSMKNIRQQSIDINGIRSAINRGDTDAQDVIYEYSYINALLLDMVVSIAKNSYVKGTSPNLLAYSNFLYLKEYTGLQRAQGVILLSLKEFDKEIFTEFVNLMAIQQQNEVMFLKYASEDIQQYYISHIKDAVFKKIWLMERTIVLKDKKSYDFNAKKWYSFMTRKLNIFDDIGKHIEASIQKSIADKLNNSINFFIIVVILSLGSWLLFVDIMFNLLKLIKEEQRLRMVMDKYVISSITDLEGRIIDVSQAFCNISGYKKEELIGRKHNIVRHKDTPKRVFQELWDKITHGESWKGKVKNRRKDGESYWVLANVEPLYDSKGRIDSYISVRMDITENELLTQKIKEDEKQKKIQEELIQQQHRLAQMGEMISMIAHQWRQPLSAITAASGAIMLKASRDKLDSQKAVSLATKIQEFSKHLSSTIDDFRNFFKSNKTKQKTDFKKIIDSVLTIVESSLEKNNIKLDIDIKDTKEFESYENELKQVVLNLVKNSEDALIENDIQDAQINIVINSKTLCISDNGGGINDDILQKIFEPYFSTKMKKDGTGLGLYMSKMIVEDHCGGKLSVFNKKDGAMFKINLGEDDG